MIKTTKVFKVYFVSDKEPIHISASNICDASRIAISLSNDEDIFAIHKTSLMVNFQID